MDTEPSAFTVTLPSANLIGTGKQMLLAPLSSCMQNGGATTSWARHGLIEKKTRSAAKSIFCVFAILWYINNMIILQLLFGLICLFIAGCLFDSTYRRY